MQKKNLIIVMIVSFMLTFLTEILINTNFLSDIKAREIEIPIQDIEVVNGSIDHNGNIEFKENNLQSTYIYIPNFNQNLYRIKFDMQVEPNTNFNLLLLKSNKKNDVSETYQSVIRKVATMNSGKYEFNNLNFHDVKDLYILFYKDDLSSCNIKINQIKINYSQQLSYVRISIMFILFCMFGMLYYYIKNNSITLATLFILVASLFGIMFTFTEVPFQVPDETPHYFRSIYISEGNFEQDGELENKEEPPGFYVNKDMFDKIMSCFSWTFGHSENVKNFLKESYDVNSSRIPLWNSTMLHPSITYIPSAIWMKLMVWIEAPLAAYIYGARLVNLIIYILIVSYTIKKYPQTAKIVFLISLFPMTLRQAAGLSQDVYINGFSFLLFSMIVDEYTKQEKIEFKNLIKIFSVAFLLGYIKFVYYFIIFLIVGIPNNRFKNSKQKNFYKYICPIIIVLGIVGYTYLTLTGGRPYINQQASPSLQMKFILTNPFLFIKILLDTISVMFIDILKQSVGYLGWNTIQINILVCVFIWIASIVLVLMDHDTIQLDGWKKCIQGIVVLMGIVLIITASYVYWSPLGNEIATNITGRYFIPIIPIIFAMIKTPLLVTKADKNMLSRMYLVIPYTWLFLSYIQLVNELYYT